MPQFQPFPGLRYAGTEDLSAVIAPPYDVISPEEKELLESRSPENSIHLILPQTYDVAARLLQTWIANGTLEYDEPTFYAYTMRWKKEASELHTTGVIGTLGLGPAETSVLPHEQTMRKAKTDRLSLLSATHANLDPIWGLTFAPYFTSLISQETTLARAVDDYGVEHELARLAQDHADLVMNAIASSPLLLADGHHRYEVAQNFWHMNPDEPGADSIMCFVTECADDQVHVEPINRLIANLPDTFAFPDMLSEYFDFALVTNDLTKLTELRQEMELQESLGLIVPEGAYVMVPTEGGRRLVASRAEREIAYVDACVFEELAVPALPHDISIEYPNDDRYAAQSVDSGLADAAMLLRAPTITQIRAAAQAGVRMPQKTTFFVPKPRTGFVFRTFNTS